MNWQVLETQVFILLVTLPPAILFLHLVSILITKILDLERPKWKVTLMFVFIIYALLLSILFAVQRLGG